MSRQDDIAAKAVRRSTLKSLKIKKYSRLRKLKADYEKAVKEINIQYAEDPERLKAKYAAAEYAKNERAKKRAEKRIADEHKRMEFAQKQRQLTVSEEIASSIVQGIGFAIFIAVTAILDTLGIQKDFAYKDLTIVIYSLYGSAMILMYLFSTLHHSLTNIGAKLVFDRLSHICSFLVIAFAYSVYSITKIQGVLGWILFGIVCAIAFVGMMFYAIAGNRFTKLYIVLYVLAGFSGIVYVTILYKVLSATCFGMLVAAAIFYVVGIIFYSLRKIKYMHLLGNILMLIGNIYMFFSLFFIN